MPKPDASTNPSGGSSFTYTKLEGNQVRLLAILPKHMETLRCEIFHAVRTEALSYVAISYVWGDENDTKTIKLNGFTFNITSSLYGALEALRHETKTVIVWADALCINQQDLTEKSEQLPRIVETYKKADSVAIWLGPEADRSDIAIKFLIDICYRGEQDLGAFIADHWRKYKPDITAVVNLFERHYWNRVWIVQEVLHARKKIVYCGSRVDDWGIYEKASSILSKHADILDVWYSPRYRRDVCMLSRNQLSYSCVIRDHGPNSLTTLRRYISIHEFNGTTPSLLDVLRECRQRVASRPNDKVFGTLGIIPGAVREILSPDYKLSTKQVYTNVVDYFLQTTKCLDVICDAISFPTPTSSISFLPTWVPDWSQNPKVQSLSHLYRFAASGTTGAKFRFDNEHRNKLEILAIPLDIIGTRGLAAGVGATDWDYLMAFVNWRSVLEKDLIYRRDDLQSVHDAWHNFCSTICCGQVPYSSENTWLDIVHHAFAQLLLGKLPRNALDPELQRHMDDPPRCACTPTVEMPATILTEFLEKPMKGRCFCLTENDGLLGMGSGCMQRGDLVVVPYGCSTPILLRKDGYNTPQEYIFVGDVYIDGYMHGRAIEELGARRLREECFLIR
jgi:hypothetical protein